MRGVRNGYRNRHSVGAADRPPHCQMAWTLPSLDLHPLRLGSRRNMRVNDEIGTRRPDLYGRRITGVFRATDVNVDRVVVEYQRRYRRAVLKQSVVEGPARWIGVPYICAVIAQDVALNVA